MDQPRRAATWNEAILDHWCDNDAPAVLTDAEVWSGHELLERAGGAACWLDEIGTAPDEIVPALLDESPAAIALTVGAALSRRALAPLGTKLPGSDLSAAVRALNVAHLVAEPGTATLAAEVGRSAGVSVHLLEEPPNRAPIPRARVQPEDLMLIVHTSGTEGLPKAVALRQRAMVARLTAYGAAIELGPGDRYCSASPFHHTAGVAMAVTALGVGAAVIPQAWFGVDRWREAGRLGVTCALLVPTMIDILLAERALGDASPRVLQYGAAPIHPDTLRAALAALPDTRFVQIFGQTEVSPMTVLSHSDHMRGLAEAPQLLATAGRAAPGVELRVEDPDDGIGELAVRTAHAFVADADGWRRTGDLGSVDAHGYVRLHGRRNDRIVRGGENIYPVEVEHVLLLHPEVREVAVVGVADRRLGELVKAVVVPHDTAAPPAAHDLIEHARGHLAHFKVPGVIEFATELPRNAGGKVLRRQLTGA